MRRLILAVAVSLLAAACTDQSLPTNPLETAPTVLMSHVGGDPATDDLCAGLSPCDAYDYDRDGDGQPDGLTGAPGFCFLPPMVDNHLSDPACSGAFRPGLDGIFKLAWCQVDYGSPPNGTQPPTIVECQDPADWKDLVQDPGGGQFYATSVRWRRSQADDGDIFRLYVVRGNVHWAHRDVIIDPNLSQPADDFVHAIGYGTEPVKVRITESLSCVYFDTQGGTPENAATCLIAGATSFSFQTNEVTTSFDFPDGNPTFLADFEVSECLSLGFFNEGSGGATGNALVDAPLADCKISLSSEELAALTVPAQINITVNDDRWIGSGGPMGNARLNVLQADELGVGALPPALDPGWFGAATSSSALLRWLDKGLDKFASLFLPQPLYAFPGAGWDFTRMSDFQVALMPTMSHGVAGGPCAVAADHCLDLGTFSGADPVPVGVQVSAPPRLGVDSFDAADTRLHFFPANGSVACPSGTLGPLDPFGRGCYPAGVDDQSTSPSSTWDHLVYVTGLDGAGSVDWTLAEGENRLDVSACGVARPGDNEPNPPAEPGGDGVWGTLGDCSDREAALTATGAYDNGPADGLTPFEPVDLVNEVAIYGLPLTFEARTCPQIVVDGLKGEASGTAEWEACAEKTGFIAPLRGPKPKSDNAWLYTYDDGDALYLALEVVNNDLGNKIFINLVEQFSGGDGVAAAGDDLLVIDFGDPTSPSDWHFTQACVGNNSSSLCGNPDTVADGPGFELQAIASVGGAGAGRVFYEFKRPLGATIMSPKEDLGGGPGQQLGLRLRVTQGQGGGKGGFVYPDPQTSPVTYHPFDLR